jgi:hypothetical protein
MSSPHGFPDWWDWDLSFTSHAEVRMEERGVTEVDVGAMLESATHVEPSVVRQPYMIATTRNRWPWVVIRRAFR